MAYMSKTTGRVVPSTPDYWVGHPAYDKTGLTIEQQRAIAKDGERFADNRIRYDLPDTYSVRVVFEPKRLMEVPTTLHFDCPVMTCSKDRTRLCVLAPNGMPYWCDWNAR